MPETNFSEQQFVERLKKRDKSAWEEIAEAYLPQILRAGRGMGFSADESRDLAQSVFLAFLEGIGRFEGRSHIRTFLFGIFYHKVAERLREFQKEKAIDPIDKVMEARFDANGTWQKVPAGIERQLLSHEIGQLLNDCLETVPRAQRIAFYLRDIEEMETAEICKNMGITATNLGVLLFRARNRLRECLECNGFQKSSRRREGSKVREEVYVHPV
jgi:RNA polymerase sigma-70 factor, ECF subfamily